MSVLRLGLRVVLKIGMVLVCGSAFSLGSRIEGWLGAGGWAFVLPVRSNAGIAKSSGGPNSPILDILKHSRFDTQAEKIQGLIPITDMPQTPERPDP